MNLLDQVQLHRKGIKHETLTFSISELVSMYSADPKEICIRPDFQRLFRWSREQQSSFIESLILEIPVPPLFFYETDQGTWDLLDGLQRLSTIIRFVLAGEVPNDFRGKSGNDNDWHYLNENRYDSPLQLLAGEYLTDLEGLSFHTLPQSLSLNFKRTRLHIYVLKRETDRMYKYEVFKRLNRGGAPLGNQEIRNCSVRLLGSEFPIFLDRIAQFSDFRAALSLPEDSNRNGDIEEFALRFFAMKNALGRYRNDLTAFLTEYMEEVTRKSLPFDESAESELFTKTWSCIQAATPDGEAFRGKIKNRNAGPFSPALFEIISLGIANNIEYVEQLPPQELKERIVAVIESARAQGYTGAGSNAKSKTVARATFGITSFSRI